MAMGGYSGNSKQRKQAKKADERIKGMVRNELERISGKDIPGTEGSLQPQHGKGADTKEKLRTFWSSTPFWAVLCMLVGAVGSQLSLNLLFFIGWAVVLFEFIRMGFVDSRKFRVVGNSIAGLLLAVLFVGLWRISPKPQTPPSLDQEMDAFARRFPFLKSQAATPQMDELKSVEQFFLGHDESELREKFGFLWMLDANIGLIAARTNYYLQHGSINGFDEAPYIFGHERKVDTLGHKIDWIGGAASINYQPNEVGIIVLSDTYSENINVLHRFEGYNELPSSVVVAVKDFESACNDNTDLLIKTLNSALRQNTDYYTHHDDIQSPYFKKIDKLYLDHFIMLQPKAAAINSAIRNFYKTS
jgi:hypothetical protein